MMPTLLTIAVLHLAVLILPGWPISETSTGATACWSMAWA